MNLGGWGKSPFEYHWDVSYVINYFTGEKGYFKFVNVFK